MLSNLIATLYFILLILRRKKNTVITFHPCYFTLRWNIPREVLFVGLPSCLMNLMGVISNIVINRLMVGYANEAVAGIGIAKKIDMMSFAIATGMSQGVLPLIGYNYSAKNYHRMMSAIKTTFLYSLGISVLSTLVLFICAAPIVHALYRRCSNRTVWTDLSADYLYYGALYLCHHDRHHNLSIYREKDPTSHPLSDA